MLGRFLEISLQAPQILESVQFYERLGFTQAPSNDTWKHPYGVLTDGRITLGLHQFAFPGPSLTYVLPELASRIEALDALALDWFFRKLDLDAFNEAGFRDPEGQVVTILEARTYSPTQRRSHETSQLGWFEEYAIPVKDLDRARSFWESIGFVATGTGEMPFDRVSLSGHGLDIALWQTRAFDAPLMVFVEPDMPERIAQLRDRGHVFSSELPRRFDPRQSVLLKAPEGTVLLLTTPDERGGSDSAPEGIIVSEGGDPG
ncbi:MAG: hypothetical protein KA224_03510 [Steroidobacteraceae bacterium]|nr:hypothetical protein [Steroidobacteraceae bacterium]